MDHASIEMVVANKESMAKTLREALELDHPIPPSRCTVEEPLLIDNVPRGSIGRRAI